MIVAYRTFFRFIGKNPEFIAALALLMFVASFAFEFFNLGSAALSIIWFGIAFQLHRALLFGEVNLWKPDPAAPKQPIVRFMLASLLLFLLPFLLAVAGAVVLLDNNAVANAPAQMTIIAVLIYAAINMVILPVFGTMLPAAAASDKFGFQLTLQRARTTALLLGIRLILASGSFWMIYLALVALFVTNVAPIGLNYTETGGFQLAQIIFGLFASVFQVLTLLMTVIVLCLSYREVAPDEIKEAMTSSFESD